MSFSCFRFRKGIFLQLAGCCERRKGHVIYADMAMNYTDAARKIITLLTTAVDI